jgi:hypothetical protein
VTATGPTEFMVRLACSCPKSSADASHSWDADGGVSSGGADLLTYGEPDRGVSVDLGRCTYCGVALLAVGAYGSESADRPVLLEVGGADLHE